jgi:GH15 family glucan-1,4-alpha-glucosidase
VAGSPSQLQILYGAAGERDLPEMEIHHLDGYEGSKPVRVGNAASQQFQLDVYGELMDAMHLARRMKIRTGANSWKLQRHVLKFVEEHWTEPDEGIWEIRGPRRHFTHSKVMAWVAVDRAVKAVEEFNLQGDLEGWRGLRQRIFDDVCTNGYNADRWVFTQYYGSRELDASVLNIALVGFLPGSDERVTGTIDAISRELGRDGFIARYSTAETDDGLPGGEGQFLACSFWLVNALALNGRVDEARVLFERLLGLSNDLGLLAEEYDVERGRQVGNFPQAFSHLTLIGAAYAMAAAGAGAEQPHGGPVARHTEVTA